MDNITVELTRDELAMLYTASFYLTNNVHPTQHLHGPSPAQTAQMKLAEAMGEVLPEAAAQDVQRALDAVTSSAETRETHREQLKAQGSKA